MAKLVAVLNAVAWSGYWAFGSLALMTPPEEGARMGTALLLAAVGVAVGLWAYFRIVAHSGRSGHARRSGRGARYGGNAGLEHAR